MCTRVFTMSTCTPEPSSKSGKADIQTIQKQFLADAVRHEEYLFKLASHMFNFSGYNMGVS